MTKRGPARPRWGRGGAAMIAFTLVLLPPCACARPGDTATARRPAPGGASSPATVHRTVSLGRSVRGRPLVAVESGDPAAPRKVLVVGCVHGDEPAGIAVARALIEGPAPAHADLWVIPVLNPDGVAARTRGNAHGVDLNRNFPARWRSLWPAGSEFFAGAGPLSEPESQAAAALIRRVRPTVGIWFHQHMAVVDTSEGPKAVARRFAREVGLPARPLTDYPGSATGWENTVVPHSAFVVELPAGEAPAPAVRRYVAAVRTVTGP
ncbi:M14 family zinc carboxypeptidase [Actinoallomurus sp. NPDC052308]|uniref:M14 family zinc carboxypeptidase n=1 Tax=Actinoallomurus sp. NPDC052308 TaxID=3155530 RepID=UPI00344766B1